MTATAVAAHSVEPGTAGVGILPTRALVAVEVVEPGTAGVGTRSSSTLVAVELLSRWYLKLKGLGRWHKPIVRSKHTLLLTISSLVAATPTEASAPLLTTTAPCPVGRRRSWSRERTLETLHRWRAFVVSGLIRSFVPRVVGDTDTTLWRR